MTTSLEATITSLANLTAYLPKHDDLTRDLNIYQKYASRTDTFIFHERTYGTLLFPVGVGVDPAHITAHANNKSAKYFKVSASGDNVELTPEEAFLLASKSPQCPTVETEHLVNWVEQFLNDNNIRQSAFVSAPIEETAPYTWREWLSWFRQIGNKPMEELMVNAINRL